MSLTNKSLIFKKQPSVIKDFEEIYSQVIEERKFVKTILSTIDEGFFILDSNLTIQKRLSDCLDVIFKEASLANKNFIDLLDGKIPEDTKKEAKEYLTYMFQPDLDEETINEMNSLQSVEFHYEDKTGLWSTSSHLSFKFKRRYKRNRIDSVLCTVKDISENVHLKEQIKLVKNTTKTQLEWLVKILHVEPPLMKEYMYIVENELNALDEIFKNQQGQGNYKPVIGKLYRSTLHIKSSASLLNLNFFNDNIIELDNIINKLRKKPDVSGADFVPIIIQIGEIKSIFKEIKQLLNQLKHFKIYLRPNRKYENGLLIKAAKMSIQNLSKEFSKKINFIYNDFKATSVPYPFQQLVREYILTLIRFIVLHSIETPKERKVLKKDPVGIIEIATFTKSNKFGFLLRHDGREGRIEKLIQDAEDDNNKGIQVNNDHNPELGSDLIRLFFTPGTSPKDLNEAEHSKSIFKDMELVKKKLKMRGGKMKITFTAEKFCEYSIVLPGKN
jgi:two-component system chemotaxis sensor kinase CheA